MTGREGGSASVRVVVRGRVQGIGFRAWTQHQAELHGLEGWVRNRRDGWVEAVLTGRPDAVGLMLKALREGPRGALVDSVEEEPAGPADLAELKQGRFVQLPST